MVRVIKHELPLPIVSLTVRLDSDWVPLWFRSHLLLNDAPWQTPTLKSALPTALFRPQSPRNDTYELRSDDLVVFLTSLRFALTYLMVVLTSSIGSLTQNGLSP